MAAHGDDLTARATTRKQLRRVCQALGLDTGLLDELVAQRVIHYCGHMISPPGERGRFPAEGEAEAQARIGQHLDKAGVGFAYGSLACGADTLFAEALLACGAELNVVLPFSFEEFLDTSVRNGGRGWEERARHCLERAATVTFATEHSYLGDDPLFAYAGRLAMGLALLRATYLDTKVEQIVVWDGGPPKGVVGTASANLNWNQIPSLTPPRLT